VAAATPPRRLAAALAAVDAADFTLPQDDVLDYARALQGLAEQEVAGVPAGPSDAAVRYTVLGTILVEPLLLALRRLAPGRRLCPPLRGGLTGHRRCSQCAYPARSPACWTGSRSRCSG
jgi:hypothetical protein